YTGNPAPNSRVALPATNFHDWNGNGSYEQDQYFILEGDQCLVFFLGGINVNGASQGFGVNKAYPANVNPLLAAAMVSTSKTETPFFDFGMDRVQILADPLGTGRSNQFRSFIDPFGSAYAYFSSRGSFGGSANQYSPDCSGLLGKNGAGTTVA